MWLDYKPTRYEGKGFLRNLNLRIHRDITGDRCGLGCGRAACHQLSAGACIVPPGFIVLHMVTRLRLAHFPSSIAVPTV